MIFDERNQRRGDQKLVRNWIEKLAEFRNLFAAARNPSVKKVRQCCRGEDRHA